jgi:hypothetical protein
MIPASSETLTIGVILLFLFGAICFYLYSRINQIEKKISLLENILLDLKVATESSIATFPFPDQSMQTTTPQFNYTFESFNQLKENIKEPIDINNSEEEILDELEEVNEFNEVSNTNEIREEQSAKLDFNKNDNTIETIPDEKQVNVNTPLSSQIDQTVSVNKTSESPYDNMTVKELQVIAKTKGISVSGMKRIQIIDLLKQNDLNKNNVTDTFVPENNEVQTIQEIFNSGEGGEILSMDAPSSLIEASSIDN